VLAASPAAARADGLPVLGIDAGPSGVARGGIRYVTLGNGARSTMVAAVRREGGQVLRAASLRGAFTVPAVALDGSASGLSADGRTLVLIRPRAAFPQARTVLAILAVPELRVRRVLRLRGDFSFDAIAPDGRSLYLIQYVSRTDATRYVVRAYDLAARRLVRAPVVDPRERGEKMRGLPLTRAASADGRWAYTLYAGGGGSRSLRSGLDEPGADHRVPSLLVIDRRGQPGHMAHHRPVLAGLVSQLCNIRSWDYFLVRPVVHRGVCTQHGHGRIHRASLRWLSSGPGPMLRAIPPGESRLR